MSALRANPPPDLMKILLGQRGFSLGPKKTELSANKTLPAGPLPRLDFGVE